MVSKGYSLNLLSHFHKVRGLTRDSINKREWSKTVYYMSHNATLLLDLSCLVKAHAFQKRRDKRSTAIIKKKTRITKRAYKKVLF